MIEEKMRVGGKKMEGEIGSIDVRICDIAR